MSKRYTLVKTVRAREWWEHKLSPMLAAMYATAHVLDVSIASLWPALLAVLVAIVPTATYVSVVNDVADREEDLAAGKTNRMADRSAISTTAFLAVPLGVGAVMVILWRDDPLLVSLYLAAWLAFSLYSLPPFRLKRRGLAGVLADACGAHLFPTLLAVVLVSRSSGRALDAAWLAAIATWAFACGLRGILWHQLVDREDDARIGVSTFATRHRPDNVAKAGAFFVFPLELAALGVIFVRVDDVFPVVALASYTMLSLFRHRLWGTDAIIVRPKPRSHLVLHEFYEAFLPAGLLIGSAVHHPVDLLILVAHLALFPQRAGRAVKDLWRMISRSGLKRAWPVPESPA
jgi:4-hydroxybenzoate polyprenyltransferase